jgi:hypothetical protein
MTSFVAAGGSDCSTSFIAAVPAAWFITAIAFIVTFLCVGRHLSNSFGDEERLSGGEEMRWPRR